MPLSLQCACGRSLRAKDELAGRTVRCPQCRGPVTVPSISSPEDEALDILLAEDGIAAGEPPRTGASWAEEEGIRRPVERPPPALPPEPSPALAKTGVKRRKRKVMLEDRLPRVVVNPQIIGGLLMIAGAVLWVSLGIGRIFFPVFLFVSGVVAVVRGFQGDT